MRFRQFKITEAPGDADFKKTLQAFYTTLTKKDPKDGFFANNARKNENMRLVAKFAQDNDLQSMLNPLTGKSYRFAAASEDDAPGETEPEEVNIDLPTLERMADVGELTPGVLEKLGNEMLAAKSGEAGLAGRTVSSLFGIKDPETADKIQNIMAKNAAARTADDDTVGQQVDAADAGMPVPGDVSATDDAGYAAAVDAADAGMPAKTKTPTPADPGQDDTPGEDDQTPADSGHPGKPHPKPSASRKNPDGSRVTYGSLAKASDIDDPNKISIGKKIKLPGGGEYIVKKGDTLSQIAQDVRLGKIGAPVDRGPTLGPEAPPVPDDTGPTLGPEAPPVPDDTGPTLGPEAPPVPDAVPLTGPTLGPEAPLPAPDLSTGSIGTGDVERATPDQEKKELEKWKASKAAPPAATAPEVVTPTATSVPGPGEVAPAVVKKKSSDVVRKPGAPPVSKKESYDGTTRLKYLAGIKGRK